MKPHDTALAALARKARLRRLVPRAGLDFTSNDFLGLAESVALRDAASAALARGELLGAGGSRLLRGNHLEHEALEAEAASFFGSEAALYFPTGYAANAALISTLPRRDDGLVPQPGPHSRVVTSTSTRVLRHEHLRSWAPPANGRADDATAPSAATIGVRAMQIWDRSEPRSP